MASALELGMVAAGTGHPVFKALEPWEARQGEGNVAAAESEKVCSYSLGVDQNNLVQKQFQNNIS